MKRAEFEKLVESFAFHTLGIGMGDYEKYVPLAEADKAAIMAAWDSVAPRDVDPMTCPITPGDRTNGFTR